MCMGVWRVCHNVWQRLGTFNFGDQVLVHNVKRGCQTLRKEEQKTGKGVLVHFERKRKEKKKKRKGKKLVQIKWEKKDGVCHYTDVTAQWRRRRGLRGPSGEMKREGVGEKEGGGASSLLLFLLENVRDFSNNDPRRSRKAFLLVCFPQ